MWKDLGSLLDPHDFVPDEPVKVKICKHCGKEYKPTQGKGCPDCRGKGTQ